MNILHLKYAVEIEKMRSINKAAENLFMAQPNLSRAVKELEKSLGITIFRRTSKGMSVTPQGEEFLAYAKKILAQVEEVEEYYRNGRTEKQKFSISVPRATYISAAFAEFAKHIDRTKQAEIYYKETNANRTIRNVLQSDYCLGIIRYQQIYDKQFKTALEERGLECELILDYNHVVIMSKDNPLASKEPLDYKELKDCIEIAHADPFVPSIPISDVQKEEFMDEVHKHIFVYERASQFDLLQSVSDTFMWVSPIPPDILDKYGLVQKKCDFDNRIYRDVLIYRKGYQFTNLDNLFIEKLYDEKRKFL